MITFFSYPLPYGSTAMLVECDAYLLALVRYVLLNPVRAGMVKAPALWRWSSYRATVGQEAAPDWLATPRVLCQFGDTVEQARARFSQFVHDGQTQPSVWYGLQGQIYLGDAQFVTRMQAHITDAGALDEIPQAQRQEPRRALDDFALAYDDRRAAMAAAYRAGTYTMKTIAQYFKVHYSTVSRAVKDAEHGKQDVGHACGQDLSPQGERTVKHVARVDPMAHRGCDASDPFRYGWRSGRCVQADGTEAVEQVPLTVEDLLYPAEDDFVVQEPVHTRDFIYCHSTLEAYYAHHPGVVVLGDCRVDWGVDGVRPLGPDLLILFSVRHWLRRATFRLAEEGGEPILVIEIASPSTREHDLHTKRQLYHQVGVQKYVVVDRGPQGDAPARLIGYQRSTAGWQGLPPDAQGRLDLAPVGLLLGIEDDRPWLYDPVTQVREPERTEWRHVLADMEARARAAEARADAEAQARAALEARLRALEEG